MTTHSGSPRVDARNANGTQIGDGGTQHNNWYVSLGLGVVAVIGVAGVVLAFTLRNVQVTTSSGTSKTSASTAVPRPRSRRHPGRRDGCRGADGPASPSCPHRGRPPRSRRHPALPQPWRAPTSQITLADKRVARARGPHRPQPRRRHRPRWRAAAPGSPPGDAWFPGAVPIRVRLPALARPPAAAAAPRSGLAQSVRPPRPAGLPGSGLFPGRVTDVSVDSRQPFPAAHSAYWTNPAVYHHIVDHLP